MYPQNQQPVRQPPSLNIPLVYPVPPKHKSSAVLIIGVILLLIVVGIIAYYMGTKQFRKSTSSAVNPTYVVESTLTPTPVFTESEPTQKVEISNPPVSSLDKEVQTRTYINEIAGFKIVFPSSWQIPNSVYKNRITPSGDGPGPGVGFQISKTTMNNTTFPLINLEAIFFDMKDADLVGQAKAYCSWLLNPGTTVKTKEILVGGHKAGYIENIITQDGSKHYASYTSLRKY